MNKWYSSRFQSPISGSQTIIINLMEGGENEFQSPISGSQTASQDDNERILSGFNPL